MADKAAKSEALYVFQPGQHYFCSECAFISEQGKCTNYIKKDSNVQPFGSCNDWRTLLHGRISGNQDRTRAETGYMENKVGFSCGRCEYFGASYKQCKKVDEKTGPLTPGVIHPRACCDFWSKSDVTGDLPEGKLRSMDNYR